MKKTAAINIIILLTVLFGISNISSAGGIPYIQEDRDRLIRVEAKIEAIDKRFEAIDRRFDDMQKQTDRLSAIFTAIVVAVIGFAIWDRRTMIRPFEKKVKVIEDEIAENRSKLHTLLEALRTLSKKNEDVAEVLKRFNLL